MTKSPHEELLARVAERLAASGAPTDHLLLTRWRVLGLAQYLLGTPSGEAEQLSVDALGVYLREGPGTLTDGALQRASTAVASATSTRAGSVLPAIAPNVRDDVLTRLDKYGALGEAAVQRAIDLLPSLRERLRKPPGGALLSGLRYRLELVAALVADAGRSADERRRAAAAILYLNEIHDAIPDSLGHIGLLDDDFALRVVLDELGEYTEDEKLHWAERISALWDDLPFLRGVRLRHEQRPVATTWLDRINSYVSYSHALGGSETPLVLVQPSVACSPLHSIVSLIGLLVLEGLTSSQDLIKSLRQGQTYEIDGKFRARYDGVLAGPPAPGWLRLTFRDCTVYRPPTLADRMVAVADGRLSSAKAFAAQLSADDAEPIQRFFDWDEAIGAASVASRVLLVASRQRATELLGGVRSNGVSLIDDGLVRFAGLTPSPDVVRAALVLVVPTLRIARDLVEQGVDVHAVLVDGYERLHRGRHDLPFLLSRASPPPIIAWSATGYYPDEPPSWLPQHRRLQVASDDLSYILELDGDLEDAMAPSRASLWEAATAAGVERVCVPWAPDEEVVLATIEEFLHTVRSCEELPDYWKYHLFSSATLLRTLVSATAAYWTDIQGLVRGWETTFQEQWRDLRPRAAERLAPVAEAHRQISAAIGSVSAEKNSKADALIAFCQKEQDGGWWAVCDRPEQAKLIGRLARGEALKLESVVLRDLGVCRSCIVIGWRSLSFARRLQAHTPRRLLALVDDREWQKWERLAHRRDPTGESLLEAVGHRPSPAAPPPAPPSEAPLDDEPTWDAGHALDDDSERRVPCVFLWLADEPQGKVLARDSRVLVEAGDQAREKPAYRIQPEDRVILGPGSSPWSPADEFTEAVVGAIEASHPQLARDAREWRRALGRLQAARHWTLAELRAHLAGAGVHRELQTLEGWLQVEQAAPIGPRHIRKELESMWQLFGEHTERTFEEVADACGRLRSLRSAAGRALLKLWQGRTVDLGVDEDWLEGLVEQLRQEVQVHAVDAIGHGMVPSTVIGWWVTPELASSFEVLQGASVHDDAELEAAEDD